MKSHRSPRRLSLLATCLLAACAQDPDLKSATPEELVRIATADLEPEEPWSLLASRATTELLRRDEAVVLRILEQAAGDPSVRSRAWAARALFQSLFHLSDPPPKEPTRSAQLALVLRLLRDSDESVRAGAVAAFGASCAARPPQALPDEVAETMRSLVGSERSRSRNAVAIAAQFMGSLIDPLVPELLARAVVEPDSSSRFLFATALANAQPGDPSVVAWLLRLLDDTDERVRAAAASGLGNGEHASPPVVDRLHAVAANANEAAHVRRCASDSLSRCVGNAQQAEAALVAVLGVKEQYHEVELHGWLEAIGRLAARVPSSEAAAVARGILSEASRSEDANAAASARTGMARMALATRDEDLGKRVADGLLAQIPAIREAVKSEEAHALFTRDMQFAIEAMVVLAPWPEMGIPVDEVRGVLEALKSSTIRWEREWSAKQRLPAR